MTLNDLKKEVASLGFESEVENADAFILAAKRALRTLYTEYTVLGKDRIIIEKRVPVLHIEHIELSSDKVEIPINGRCFSFTATGRGSYSVKDGYKTRFYPIRNEGERHRGIIEGGTSGVLEFSTDYTCAVYDLAVFDRLYGQSTSDVPIYTPFTEYDLKGRIPSLSSLTAPPSDDFGRTITRISASGTKLCIPRDFSGAINLSYKKSAPDLSGNSGEIIDVPPECEHLLPLLVSFYVWLDDDPEKAAAYMSLFREGLSAVKLFTRPAFDNKYRDVTGWA